MENRYRFPNRMCYKYVGSFGPAHCVAALMLFAALRIIDSYWHVSQTYDEPFHILRGVHWHSGHQYTHSEHPPLAPLVFAALPSIWGVEVSDTDDKKIDGNSILYTNGDYKTTLASFRLGNLVFFGVTCVLVYIWLAMKGLRWEGVASVFLFSLSPIVVAHAGLATTDFAITATVLFFVVALEQAMERPSLGRWTFVGIACGLAMSAKFSAFLFLPSCFVFFVVSLYSTSWHQNIFKSLIYAFAFCFTSLLVVWAIYRFSLGRLDSIEVRLFDFKGFQGWIGKLIVPAPEFFAGFTTIQQLVAVGFGDYFFGKTQRGGALMFFPTVLTIKTPISILLCLVLGLYHVLMRNDRCSVGMRSMKLAGLMLFALMFTTINVGVRHALPIIPFISIIAGIGLYNLFERLWYHGRNAYYSSMPVFFLAYLIFESVSGHPHALSYFNCLVCGKPEKVVVDSDLDWGQGIFELQRVCKQHDIQRLRAEYFGSADLSMHSLPLIYDESDDYWIAISVTKLYKDDELVTYRDIKADIVIPGGAMRLYWVISDKMHRKKLGL
jgi:4-amino-4-deoxy-L-arabinose transferase-like glycosyltransferase